MAASAKLDMQNWTIAKDKGMSLAQAFGVDKGTVSFPKLQPRLAVAAERTKPASTVKPSRKHRAGLPQFNTAPPQTGQTEHDNYELAKRMARQQPYGWTDQNGEMQALNNIVMAESGWNVYADNPSSGAYGIPQALPGSKMASAGKDWQTSARTQIRWMLSYIRSRYGDPIAAWQFHLANGWY